MDRGRVKPESGLNVRQSPNGDVMDVLHHNDNVAILDEVTYYRVKTLTGKIGYVDGRYLEKLPQKINLAPTLEEPEIYTQAYRPVNFVHQEFLGEKVKADEDFIPALNRIAEFAKKCDVKIWVTSSARSLEDKVQGAIVKPASNSCHHIGHAIDMNILHEGTLYNSKKLKKSNLAHLPQAIKKFIDMIRDDGILRWGGDFSVEDPVHIDDNFFHRQKIFYLAKIHSRVDQLNA